MNIETLFTFKGKMKRLPFFGVQVGVIVLFALAVICGESSNDTSEFIAWSLLILGSYFNLISTSQRLQDIGLSGLYTIPIVLFRLAGTVYPWTIAVSLVVTIWLFVSRSDLIRNTQENSHE